MPVLERVSLRSLAIVAAIAVVYRQAPGGYWFEDDFQWLVTRASFSPSHLLHIDLYDHFYRPMIELYFWAGLRMFGRSATAFHLASLMIHAANALLLFQLARAISGSVRYGFVAALSFAVMPAYVEAIAWASALAEPLAAFFGLPAIYCWIQFRKSGRRPWHVAAVLLFALSLLTHESSVVFLALLGLADLAFAGASLEMQTWRGWGRLVRDYLPFAVVAAAYLAIDLTVNSRSYMVRDGSYVVGPHVVTNIFSYIVSLLIGKRGPVWYGAIGVAIVVLFARGTPRVRFATAWLLLGILPFALFRTDNISRYQYLPAMGLGLLLADGIDGLDRWAQGRVRDRARQVIVPLVFAVIVVRFMVFASGAVAAFAARTETWRDLGAGIRSEHPSVARGGDVTIERAIAERHGFQYLEALVRWELQDPTIRVVLR